MRRSRWHCLVALVMLATMHGASRADENDDISPARLAWLKAAQSSGDLRLRVVFSSFPAIEANGKILHDRTPMHALLDAARGSTDPLVLQLLLARCRTASRPDPACDEPDLARRWTQAETQNQAAWIAYATVLEANGDPSGAESAWKTAGQASTYHDIYAAVLRIIVSALPTEPDPRRHYLDLLAAFGIAAAIPSADHQDAYRGCKVATRREPCARIADVMSRDADNVSALLIAKWISAYAGQPDDLVRAREERMRAMQWAVIEMNKGLGDPSAVESADPKIIRAANATLEALARRGELASAQDFLTRHRLTIAEAAMRDANWRAKLASTAR